MTEKKDEGFIDILGGLAESVDPAVAALMGKGEQRARERQLPAKERKRKAKEREKARKRSRVMLDLPERLVRRVKGLAEANRCPESQVAMVLMAQGLVDLEEGRLDLGDYKTGSDSPRYDWNLRIEGTPLEIK